MESEVNIEPGMRRFLPKTLCMGEKPNLFMHLFRADTASAITSH